MSSSYYGQYTELDKPEGYLWLTDEYKKLQQQIERLQEQLEEANEVIKKYRRFEVALKVEKGVLTGVYPAVDYLKKYNIS